MRIPRAISEQMYMVLSSMARICLIQTHNTVGFFDPQAPETVYSIQYNNPRQIAAVVAPAIMPSNQHQALPQATTAAHPTAAHHTAAPQQSIEYKRRQQAKRYMQKVLNAVNVLYADLSSTAEDNDNYIKAAEAACVLYATLSRLNHNFFNRHTISASEFKTSCTNAMNTAHDVLKEHRGWHRVWTCFKMVLFSLVTLCAFNIENKITKGEWSLLGKWSFLAPKPTRSIEKLDIIQKDMLQAMV